MTKFAAGNDPGYRAILGFIRRAVNAARAAADALPDIEPASRSDTPAEKRRRVERLEDSKGPQQSSESERVRLSSGDHSDSHISTNRTRGPQPFSSRPELAADKACYGAPSGKGR